MGRSAQNPDTSGHEYNRWNFVIEQFILNNVHTALPVRVEECFPTPPGVEAGEKIGFVNVKLAVEQVDNDKKLVETRRIFNMPYCRIQGGVCGFVVDPEPGDWGIAIFAERDISKWKRSLTIAVPDTYRYFSQADGFYLGGFRNKEPEIYIQLHPEKGVVVESGTTDLTVHVGSNTNIIVEGDANIQVSGNYNEIVDGDKSTTIKGNMRTEVEGSITNVIKGSCQNTIDGGYNINATGNIQIHGANVDIP